MARLIDADAAKIRFANYREDCINEDDINAANVFADVVSELDEFPTIDPVTAAAEALGMSPDRLRELAQAKKEGRLVVLPCEIGSPVYSHARKLDGADYVRETEFWWSDIPQMSKTVFLTREAAEAALDAMGGENNA